MLYVPSASNPFKLERLTKPNVVESTLRYAYPPKTSHCGATCPTDREDVDMTTERTKKTKTVAVLPETPRRSIAISMNVPTSLQNCAEAEGKHGSSPYLRPVCLWSLTVCKQTRFYPEVAI